MSHLLCKRKDFLFCTFCLNIFGFFVFSLLFLLVFTSICVFFFLFSKFILRVCVRVCVHSNTTNFL